MAEKPGDGCDPVVRTLTGRSAPGLEQEHGNGTTGGSCLCFCAGHLGALGGAHLDRNLSLRVCGWRGTYLSSTASPSCCETNRPTRGFNLSPVFASTKSCSVSDQSSLKLVVKAEIHICRTGAFGETTNRAPSSKLMCSAPDWSSTSMSASSSAANKDFFSEANASSERLRNSSSSIIWRL